MLVSGVEAPHLKCDTGRTQHAVMQQTPTKVLYYIVAQILKILFPSMQPLTIISTSTNSPPCTNHHNTTSLLLIITILIINLPIINKHKSLLWCIIPKAFFFTLWWLNEIATIISLPMQVCRVLNFLSFSVSDLSQWGAKVGYMVRCRVLILKLSHALYIVGKSIALSWCLFVSLMHITWFK